MPGTVPSNEPSTFQGPVRALGKETDGEVWIPGFDFMFDLGTWTATRSAAGNWFMRKTAAANTPKASVALEPYFQKKVGTDPQLAAPQKRPAHDIRGCQVTTVDVVYAITTAALNSHALVINQATYANNTAVGLAAAGGSLGGSLAVTTQANPYLTTITPGTIFIPGTNTVRTATSIELQIDAAATSVYDLYGIFVRFNYNIL